MLELIILYFLCKKNASLAEQKGVSKTRWILTTFFYWGLFEILMMTLFISILKIDLEAIKEAKKITMELLILMATGLLGGFLGYLFVRKRIESLPDPIDLDNI